MQIVENLKLQVINDKIIYFKKKLRKFWKNVNLNFNEFNRKLNLLLYKQKYKLKAFIIKLIICRVHHNVDEWQHPSSEVTEGKSKK